MSPAQVVVPIFTHLLPILFFAYMGMDMLIRDAKRVEHRLISLVSLCFMMLFLEEYVRHQLPIAYSPALSAMWLSSAGILIPGLGFHIFVKLAKLDRKMPRYVYPYIFYLPVILVFINLLQIDRVISVSEFYEAGIWKHPVYDRPYYIAMIGSVVNNLLYLIPLTIGRRRAATPALKGIYDWLIFGVAISAVWFGVFGLIETGGNIPPYPYIYGGLVWCFILRRTMRKFDFLNFTDKRFEKLFNLNPAAILLADLQGHIKEANPSAKQLFSAFHLDPDNLWKIVDGPFRALVSQQRAIKNYEMTIASEDGALEVLIEGDYVLVEHQPHMIIILRDVTLQKEDQRKVAFLAYHDPLTGLPNRRHFQDTLEEALEQAGKQRRQAAVVLIDLDHFKEVNDQYGHQVGDEVLAHTASLIRETIAEDGMAARLGGDEFVFFIRDVPDAAFVEEKIIRLQQAFAQRPPMYKQMTLPVGMSIGASLFPAHGQTIDELLKRADKAMYQVKREGKNSYRLLSTEAI